MFFSRFQNKGNFTFMTAQQCCQHAEELRRWWNIKILDGCPQWHCSITVPTTTCTTGYQYCIKSSKILCNSDVSSYLPVSGDELQKQVQASRCHIHTHTHTHTKKNPCAYVYKKQHSTTKYTEISQHKIKINGRTFFCYMRRGGGPKITRNVKKNYLK